MIAGRVVLPDGLPIAGVVVTLWTVEEAFEMAELSTPQRLRLKNGAAILDFTDADGAFAFEGVLPGVYRVHAKVARLEPDSVGGLSTALGADPALLGPGETDVTLVLPRRSVTFRLFPRHDDWRRNPSLELLEMLWSDPAHQLTLRMRAPLRAARDSQDGGRAGGETEPLLLPLDVRAAVVRLTDSSGRGLESEVTWPTGSYRPVVDVVQQWGTARLRVTFSSSTGPVVRAYANVERSTPGDARAVPQMPINSGPGVIELWVPPGPLIVTAGADGHPGPRSAALHPYLDSTAYPEQRHRIAAVAGELTELHVELAAGGWVVVGAEGGLRVEELLNEEFLWPELRALDAKPSGEFPLGAQSRTGIDGATELVFASIALPPGAYEVRFSEERAIPVTVRAGEVSSVDAQALASR